MPTSTAPRKTRIKKSTNSTAPSTDTVVVVPESDTDSAVGNAVTAALVPDQSVASSYIHRTLPGGIGDFALFDFARKQRIPLLIEGPTGPGKTMATRAYAATHNLPVARVACNVGIEPSQLFGKFLPQPDGSFAWVDGPVTQVVRNGGVLLINEVNFMPDRVGTVLFGLLDGNREIVLLDKDGEVVKAHPDLLIVADMNPDYEGTRPLNKAFRNRFGLQVVWDYDPNVEATLVRSKSLLTMAAQLRREAAQGAYETPVSTNMLMEFERIADGLGTDFAFSNFENHFSSDERPSVKVVWQTHKGNIEADYKAPVLPEPEDDDKGTGTAPVQRDSKYDPQWDVYGIDWVYADEAN